MLLAWSCPHTLLGKVHNSVPSGFGDFCAQPLATILSCTNHLKPRIKQTNELQSMRISPHLCNPSSNLLAQKLPLSFGYSQLEMPFLSGPSFPAPPHPSPTRVDTKNSCHRPYTQGVAPSSGLGFGPLHTVNWKQRLSVILLFLYCIPQALKRSQVWEVLVVWWTADLCKAIRKPAQEDIVFQGNRSVFLFLHQILCYLLADGSLHIRSCLKTHALGILALD